jgi:protein tyrosine/serine phosphatase
MSTSRDRATTEAIEIVDRHLVSDGCFNVRDLGGFPTASGRLTRSGAVVRSDEPDRLSEAGWRALRAHGVRTIVDLRDPVERGGEAACAELGLCTCR